MHPTGFYNNVTEKMRVNSLSTKIVGLFRADFKDKKKLEFPPTNLDLIY